MLSFRRRERLPQVVLIETGLIFPQGDYSTKDLVSAREYRACFTLTDPRFRREVPGITNNNNRRDSRDRSILEHTDESGALVRPVLFSTTDVAHGGQLQQSLECTGGGPGGGIQVLCRQFDRYHPVRMFFKKNKNKKHNFFLSPFVI